MNALRQALAMALGALLLTACNGRTMQSDAGAGHHDAAEQDAVPDTPFDAGPRVRDVCHYQGQEAHPQDPHYVYAYDCEHELSDPDCIEIAPLEHDPYFDGDVGYQYDCKTPP